MNSKDRNSAYLRSLINLWSFVLNLFIFLFGRVCGNGLCVLTSFLVIPWLSFSFYTCLTCLLLFHKHFHLYANQIGGVLGRFTFHFGLQELRIYIQNLYGSTLCICLMSLGQSLFINCIKFELKNLLKTNKL